jgi:CHRD domain
MKKTLIFSLLALFTLTFSCKKDEVVNPEVAVIATLSGANEVPAVATTATGSVTGTFNKTTKILSLTVTYAGVTPTAWHIHKGAVGTSGGVVLDLGTTFGTPFTFTTTALDATKEADLLAGMFYVNIHSTKQPGGEIRGNITVK